MNFNKIILKKLFGFGDLMKTILSISLAAVVLFWGCDTSPDLLVNSFENNNANTFSKITQYDLIPLPQKSALWQDSVLTVSKVINGNLGDSIELEKYYISEKGDSITVWADLTFPPGSFNGIEEITITVDDEFAFLHFTPSMVFQDTLKLFQGFRGLDLSNYDTGTIDFVYLKDDGTIELIKKNGVQIVKPQGIVRVQNAKILHFSKFGWIRSPLAPVPYPTPVSD